MIFLQQKRNAVHFQFQIMSSISRSFYCSSLRVHVFIQLKDSTESAAMTFSGS